MCCRYWIDESQEMDPILDQMMRSPLIRQWQKTAKVLSSGEIRPMDVVPVIAPDRTGQRAVFPMRWGFSGRTLLMNARVETAATKPTFREAWERHRCIVPASYYFEWEHLVAPDGKKKAGQRFMIQPEGSAITWLCGLYRFEQDMPVFVILTRSPGAELLRIHDRMPLIMPEHLVDEWIRPGADPAALVRESLTEMVAEAG